MLSSGEDTLDMILQVAHLKNATPAVELRITPATHNLIKRERSWGSSNRDQLAFMTACRPMTVTITDTIPNFPGFEIIRGDR